MGEYRTLNPLPLLPSAGHRASGGHVDRRLQEAPLGRARRLPGPPEGRSSAIVHCHPLSEPSPWSRSKQHGGVQTSCASKATIKNVLHFRASLDSLVPFRLSSERFLHAHRLACATPL